MFSLRDKPDMGAKLCAEILQRATHPEDGLDTMAVIQAFAGVAVETMFVFEHADTALEAFMHRLADALETDPAQGVLLPNTLPPAHVLDLQTERGRSHARIFFEQWMDCEYEFLALLTEMIRNLFVQWEGSGLHRGESLRLFSECTWKAMAFEVAAQELCDVVIDNRVARDGWGFSECIASLSAAAGRRMALSLEHDVAHYLTGIDSPENIEKVMYVMTQEAIRHGVPAGSDWRFGLPANDVPANAPESLISAIEPYCYSFFATIGMFDRHEQAVACAKAAGRMLAVAAGGEEPEVEPTIAKPLALSAMIDTYRFVCMDSLQLSL